MRKNTLQDIIEKTYQNVETAKFAISQYHRQSKNSTKKIIKSHWNNMNKSLRDTENTIATLEQDLNIQNKTKLGKWLASFGAEKEQKKEFDALKLLKKNTRKLIHEIDILEERQKNH